MRINRAWIPVLVCIASCLAGCSRSDVQTFAPPSPVEGIDRALSTAREFLIARQVADGSWRSDLYGPFKDGTALTPLVLEALRASSTAQQRSAAYERGLAYLAAFAQPDGSIQEGSHGIDYPIYTAAGAVALLSGKNKNAKARDAWLAYLRQRQLVEALGWQPEDRAYGGWGYCPVLPHKPPAGQPTPPLTESNLSATVAALSALRSAGIPVDDPAVQKALMFVRRCQNFGDDLPFDDGGFYFIYDDPVRNKAGVAGRDRHGHERYVSYGSATADGLRAFALCGLSPAHPRLAAARRWLVANFSATEQPGGYPAERESQRNSLYYYYACSAAQALRAAGVKEMTGPDKSEFWAKALAETLLQRQRDDGSWINPAGFIREDDPLVATALAVQALAGCRESMAITDSP